ncbi:hypothetical protein WJX74_002318 [Apatococcus lobatus]|uniref:Uncharacterized protein n=1 Tax=Apatococcus lobatus TaxID=904363 RepID=A0AAW1S1V4_9CHLO
MLCFRSGLPCQTRAPYCQRSRLDLGQVPCSSSCGPIHCDPFKTKQTLPFSSVLHSQRVQRRPIFCRADEGTPGVTELSDNLPPVPDNTANRWPKFIGLLFLSGVTLGPLLDSFHSSVHLLEYDKAAFKLLGVDFSLYEIGVLGLLYVSIGVAQILADGWEKDWCDPATTELYTYRLDIRNIILSTAILAGYLYTSAQLYAEGVPFWKEGLTMAPLALAIWRVFDGTKSGGLIALAMLVGAPVIEFGIIQELGWWHYPKADLFGSVGLPSWVPWCYFAYTPATANLARWFWKRLSSSPNQLPLP